MGIAVILIPTVMRIIWAGHIGRMGLMRNAHDVLVQIHQGKESVGILAHRPTSDDNIKMHLRVTGCGMDSYGSRYVLISDFCERGNES
jgi:hypothetical protein